MKHILWVVLAIVCNAGAQVALKLGASHSLAQWQTWLSVPIVAGLFLYGLSFALTIKIYAYYPLSIISPAMAGAIFLLITVASYFFFSEPITFQKLAGIAFVVLGIAILAKAA